MSLKNLTEVYLEHAGYLSDKWSLYLREYDSIFAEYREKNINMLEIGVQNGGSLEIWTKYFSKANNIIGCDVNEDCAILSFSSPNTNLIIGNANDDNTKSKILNISPDFDIVIDDGSHNSSDIVKSFCKYFPTLKDTGIFVAEDLHCSYWKELQGGLYSPFSSISFFKRLADIVNHEHLGIKRSRKDLIAGFITHYGLTIEENDLEKIHSVTFVNSLCIIKKNIPDLNTLGKRVVRGEKCLVYTAVQNLNGSTSLPMPQMDNDLSTLTIPPEEAYFSLLEEIKFLKNDIAHLNNDNGHLKNMINQIENSASWRLTKPLRKVNTSIKKIFRLIASH